MALPRAWGPSPMTKPGPTTYPVAPHAGTHHAGPPQRHPTTPAAPAGAAGASGLPTLKSSHQIQAEANKQAWDAISKMMGALPSFGTIDQPYTAQRAAIQPLVDQHRQWLLNAGDYQTKVANGLAQIAGTAGSAADASQAGFAARAGAPMGSAPASNVSPGALSMTPAAEGGSTANYLHALALSLPAALGTESIGGINAKEATALGDMNAARANVAGKYGDLSTGAFNSLQKSYFDQYKSELAAIAAGTTAGIKRDALTHKITYDQAGLKIKQQNADTASSRVSAATTAAATRASQSQGKADRTLTEKALADARKMYANLGGVKSPGAPGAKGKGLYVVTLTLQAPKPLLGSPPKPYVTQIYGATPAEAVHKANVKKAQVRPDLTDPSNPGHWDTSKVMPVSGTTSSSGSSASSVKDRPSESTRRLRAWRTFKADLTALNSPLTTKQMQSLFRTQFGDPAKTPGR